MSLLALALLAFPAAAQREIAASTAPIVEASTASTGGAGSVRLLSVGSYQAAASMPHMVPFERLLAEGRPRVELLDVENVPAYFNGGAYKYRLPEAMEDAVVAPSTGAAKVAAMESEYGFFLLWPPEPALMAAALEAFRKPGRYRRPMSPRVSERKADVLVAPAAEGGWVHSATIDTPRPAAAQWRKTIGTAYRLRVGGRRVEAVFLQKTLGGLARLASALAEERAAGKSLVVSRGAPAAQSRSGTFPAPSTQGGGDALEGGRGLEALEGLGLSVSAVALGELRNWDDVVRYRVERPTGTAFVAANLVWASSPTVTAVEPFVVREVGGLRVGLLGLTRLSYARYLAGGRWKNLAVVDPVAATLAHIQELRDRSDLVVVLSNLEDSDSARVREAVRGIDVFLADDEPFLPVSAQPKAVRVMEPARARFAPSLMTATEYRSAITVVEALLGERREDGTRPLQLASSYRVLDEGVADDAAFPELNVDAYGVAVDTRPPLIPSARRLWPTGARGSLGVPILGARDFWTLSASLAADRAGAELGLLPVMPIAVRTTGDYREGQVRDWFPWDDTLVAIELPGSAVRQLMDLSSDEAKREADGLPARPGQFRFVVAGAPEGTVHGSPIAAELIYRVAISELLLGNSESIPPLAGARVAERFGGLRDEVLAALLDAAERRWPVAKYRALAEGAPVRETGVWRIGFRDISANITNTRVVKDAAAFAAVPNSRVQGFDQQVVGVTAKTDASYSYRDYRWSNSFELEYSKARLRPPGQPEVVNTPNNRLAAQTLGTRRVAGVSWPWLARSIGPAFGVEYEGQVENTPGLRKKEIYSVLPGVELFDGTFVQSLQLSASIKRDLSRLVPNTQYGLRERLVISAPLRAARLQAELLTRYFFLTPRDAPEDLRLESDLNFKVMVPLYKGLTLAPFADLYVFQLKTSPKAGYSFITGISLGFSRLWKPGYEKF